MKRLLLIGILLTQILSNNAAANKHAEFLQNLAPDESEEICSGPAISFADESDRKRLADYVQWLSNFNKAELEVPAEYLDLHERMVQQHPTVTFRNEKARETYLHSLGFLTEAHAQARLKYEEEQQWEKFKEDTWIKHRHIDEEDRPQQFPNEAAERYQAAMKDPAFRVAEEAAAEERKAQQAKKDAPVVATPAPAPVVVQHIAPVAPVLTSLQLAKIEMDKAIAARDAAEKVLKAALAERDAIVKNFAPVKRPVNPETEEIRKALAEARKEAELNQIHRDQCQDDLEKALEARDQADEAYWKLAEQELKKNAPHVDITEAKKDWDTFMKANNAEGIGTRLVRYFKVGFGSAAITGSILCILEMGRQIHRGNATTITEALKIVLRSQFKNIKMEALLTGTLCAGNQALRDAFCAMWTWCFGADETSTKESLFGRADRYISAGIAAPILAGAGVFCLNLWLRMADTVGFTTVCKVSVEGISRVQLCLTGSFGEMMSDLFKPSAQ
jgi:hypothetical protein